MNLKIKYHINQLRDYSTLFSRSEVNRWIKGDFKAIDLKLKRYDSHLLNNHLTYLSYLKYIYVILEEYYPNEYIFKNELLNKWLVDELGSNNSIIFNEFRIGRAIGDIAIFNGISKVFEIKTVLDKDYRLSSQLQEYKNVFNEIYLIVPDSCLEKYINYDVNVGVIVYKSKAKNFELIRKSFRNLNIDPCVLMEILHTNEYKAIVKSFYGNLPDINSFNQFNICKGLISEIPTEKLNSLFLETMKKRKINNVLFDKDSSELNQICLSLNLNETQKEDLIGQLKNTIDC